MMTITVKMTMAIKMTIIKLKIMKVMLRMMKTITLMTMKPITHTTIKPGDLTDQYDNNLKTKSVIFQLIFSTNRARIKIITIHFLALFKIYLVTEVPGAAPRPASWLLTTPIFFFFIFISYFLISSTDSCNESTLFC